jgi:hypothetical protein
VQASGERNAWLLQLIDAAKRIWAGETVSQYICIRMQKRQSRALLVTGLTKSTQDNGVCGWCTDIQAPVPACMVRHKADQETNPAHWRCFGRRGTEGLTHQAVSRRKERAR